MNERDEAPRLVDADADGTDPQSFVDPAERTELAEAFGRGRLLRGGATVMIGTVLQKLVNVAFIVVFARELSRGQFDMFVFGLAFGVFFETFSDFGMDFVLTRELNQRGKHEHGAIVGTAMAIKAVTFLITFALAVGTSLVKPEYRGAALIATLGMFCGIPGTIGLALRARMKTTGPEVITTIAALVTSAALIVAVLRGASVIALTATYVACRFASTLLILPLRRGLPYQFRFDRGLVRPLLRAALPVALSTFAIIVYSRGDQLVLGVVGATGELGQYAVAVRVVDAINFLPAAIGAIALPTFSHLEGFDEPRFRRLSERAIRYVAIIILPLAALATLEGGALLATLFGERFRGEGTALAVLVWAHFFAASWVLGRPILIARRRASYLSLLAVVAAVVNISLNLWLIPRYGGVGAAWASLVSYASPFAAAAFLPVVRSSVTTPLLAAIRPLVASGALLALLSVLPGGPLITVAGFAVALPVLLLASGSVTVAEVKQMAGSFVRGR